MDWKRRKRIQQVSRFVLFVFFLCLGASQHAQDKNINLKRISLKEGLAQSVVYCILQDRKGFLWFGTQDGLHRYDGYEFKIYKYDPNDKNTISDAFILCIHEDSDGILWIGTRNGLNKFNPKTEQFDRYQYNSKKADSLSHNEVMAIYEDKKEEILWIGTRGGGLNKFDPKTRQFKHYTTDHNLPHNDVRAIFKDKSGILWIGTYGGGICKFNWEENKFIYLNLLQHRSSKPSSEKILVIREEESKVLWVGTAGNGLFAIDGKTADIKHYTTQSSNSVYNDVRAIYEDKSGILWVGTMGGGLNQFDRSTGKFIRYNAPNAKTSNYILSILEDKSGLLWLGTFNNGLNRIDRNINDFSSYTKNISKGGLSDNSIYAIYEDSSETLWIGTEHGGLNMFNRETGRFKWYTKEYSNLNSNDVRAICEGSTGALWIGTNDKGLNMLNQKTGRFTHFVQDKKDLNSLSNNRVRFIYKDSSQILWVGTGDGGLNKFDREKNLFKRYLAPKARTPKFLSDNWLICIIEDRTKKNLWIGTRGGGLNRFDPKTETFQHYTTTNSNLSHNFILSLYEDKNGILWIGTFGGGLNKMMDREKREFISYVEKDGLPSNVIYGIREDKKGNLWMSTNRGISKFNLKTNIFKNYDVHDGLQSNEFNQGAYFKNLYGKMFFGGISGVTAFLPEKIKDNKYLPPVVITNFYLSNKRKTFQCNNENSSYDIDNLGKSKMVLSYEYQSFSLGFAALDFTYPMNNKYKYMLDGFDKGWNDTDAGNRRATYTNLPAGDYVFRVKGSNEDGVWNEEGRSIKIKVLPPWWKTWWAYIIYIFLFFLLVLLGWSAWSKRYLMKQIKTRTDQLIGARNKAALGILVANMNHEFNNPASAAYTSTYNLREGLKEFKEFLNELTDDETDGDIREVLAERFNKLFDIFDPLNKSIKKIASIVERLNSLLPKETKMARIDLPKVLESTIDLAKTKYKNYVTFITSFQKNIQIEGNTDELIQVCMSILENACYSMVQKQKSTRKDSKRNLTVQLSRENGDAAILFRDTGTGMTEEERLKMFDPFFSTKPEGEGEGLGLAISHNIVEKYGGRFEVESEEGGGALITLYLPLKRKKKSKVQRG